MQPSRRLITPVGSISLLLLVLGGWLVFAPVQLGGRTSYVIVTGNSMEPRLYAGDLVLVREASTYHIGEIVTYRHPDIGKVIHRITGRDDERYLFRGDHNDFTDPYHPEQADLQGRLWFSIPAVGGWLSHLRSPFFVAGLAIAAFAVVGGTTAANNQKKGQKVHQGAGWRPWRSSMPTFSRQSQDAFTVLGVAALALAVIAVVAFRAPPLRPATHDIAYQQSGRFDYQAAASNGAVYDSGAATTGEPVYRRLSDGLVVGFTYGLSDKAGTALPASGSYQLIARISAANGWKRSIELGGGTFSAVPFTFAGTLTFAELQRLISSVESQTGVSNPSYTVTLMPRIETRSEVGGLALEASFAPELALTLDPLELRMAPPSGGNDPLVPLKGGVLTAAGLEPNTKALPLVELPVTTWRWLAVGGLGLLLAAAGVVVFCSGRMAGADPRSALAAQLGDSLISVSRLPRADGASVELSSLADVEKIASREGSVTLREGEPGSQTYFIRLGGITYRFQELREAKPQSTSRRPGEAA